MHDDDDNDYTGDDEVPAERARDPKQRVQEKADFLRMHAELAAIYEGPRKFDAEVKAGLDASLARDIQRAVGKLANAREPETPVLPQATWPAALDLLVDLPAKHALSTNDYHVHRRPGEVMVVRWLAGEQVDAFYDRMQAHFDAALNDAKQNERITLGYKDDDATQQYLDALDKLEFKMADRYLRDAIRVHRIFVCSTLAADEIHIGYLCNHLMGVDIADLVGPAAAPAPDAPEREMAWFYKLFSIRGLAAEGEERMCFFTYLQKTDDDPFDLDE